MSSDKKLRAKREILEDLKKVMSDDMYGGIPDMLKGKEMKKVTVASDSPEGLEEGLSKAQQILKKKELEDAAAPEMEDEEEYEDESEMEEDEMEDESKESLEAQIEELQRKLNSLS